MGLTAEKLKEIKDQGDLQVINDTYADRCYLPFAMLVRVRVKPSYNNERNPDGSIKYEYQFFCSKVLEHSYKIENEILVSRL